MTTPPLTPFEWVSSHLQLVGWPALIGIAWTFRGLTEKLVQKWEAIDNRSKETLSTVASVKAQTDAIASNHLSHIESDMSKQTGILESIDKNIAVLVDRRG
jgi:hypothetical protein